MPIYDKPTKILMKEFVSEKIRPGQIFDKRLAVDWFGKRYPSINPNTVQMHVEGMAVNSTARKHHQNIKPGSEHDLFFKVGPGQFRLWAPESDPPPIYRDAPPVQGTAAAQTEESEEVEGSGEQFAFERDLKNYLAKNLNKIEGGLIVYQDEEFTGIEFPVGGRFIDILAVDERGDFVVIELKVSRGYDRVVGQILRYMAWVKANLAKNKNVRGVIVASEVTEDLKLAASLVPSVQLMEYKISMSLTAILTSSAP